MVGGCEPGKPQGSQNQPAQCPAEATSEEGRNSRLGPHGPMRGVEGGAERAWSILYIL